MEALQRQRTDARLRADEITMKIEAMRQAANAIAPLIGEEPIVDSLTDMVFDAGETVINEERLWLFMVSDLYA